VLLRPGSQRKIIAVFAKNAKRRLLSDLGFASGILSSQHSLDYSIFPLVCRIEGWEPAVDIPFWQRFYITLKRWK